MAIPRPFPTDPRLTGIVIAYPNTGFIADQVLPRVPVGKQDFKYLSFDKNERLTPPDDTVGRKSVPNEVDFSASEKTASTADHGLDDLVPNDDIPNAPEGLDPIGDAAEGLTDLIMVNREIRVATKVMATGTYASGNQVSVTGTDRFDDAASNPIILIADNLESVFVRPNVLVMGNKVWTALRTNKAVVAAINPSGSGTGMVTRQAVADLLEIDEILVGSGWKNTAKPGQTASLARVWADKSMAAIYRNPTANTRRGVTFGFTAQFGTRVSGQIPEPKVGLRGAQRVRVGESVKELVVAADLGFLFKTVIS